MHPEVNQHLTIPTVPFRHPEVFADVLRAALFCLQCCCLPTQAQQSRYYDDRPESQIDTAGADLAPAEHVARRRRRNACPFGEKLEMRATYVTPDYQMEFVPERGEDIVSASQMTIWNGGSR